MEQEPPPANALNGCAALGIVSVGASIVGSLVGAACFVGWWVANSPPDDGAGQTASAFGLVWIVAMVGMVVSVPAGLLIGVPLLANLGPSMPKHRYIISLGLGVFGAGAGWLVGRDVYSTDGAYAGLFFGAAIGAMHGLFYPRR